MPTKVNYKIIQGSTFQEVIRWESATKVFKTITGISKAAPTVVSCPAHGMKVGGRFRITNVLGMKEINTDEDEYYIATNITTDDITIGDLNSLGFSTYTSGGVIEYYLPMALEGVTARMQIREKLTSSEIIDELTTENGKIVVNSTNGTITLKLSDANTAGYTFNSAVYSLEVATGGTVVQLLTGTLTLVREVTR